MKSRNNDNRQLTQKQMILVAMYHASGGTTSRVPYEELALQAWRDFPHAYSLRNHPEYPDPSDIHKALYKDLKSPGLVVALGNKMFRLTEKGLAEAEEIIALLDGAPSPQRDPTRLTRDEDAFIRHARQSRAFSSWQSGHPDRLVDYDARSFFRFSTGTPVAERRRRVAFARDAITKAIKAGVESAADLETLADYLAAHFRELLEEV